MNVCSVWPFAQILHDFYYLSWHLALFQIFCCSIIEGVNFNYHQRNVRSLFSVSNFQVSVSSYRWSHGLKIWASFQSRRLRSQLHHWV